MVSNMVSRGMTTTILGMTIALAACGSASQQHVQSSAYPPAYPPLQIRLQTDRFEFTTPEELCNPILTAEVVIGLHGIARWNTTDGKRPAVATGAEVTRQGYFIYNTVSFARMTPLHDRRTTPTSSYITIGGEVGPDSYYLEDLPQLSGIGGHYVVVFAPPTSTTGLPTGSALLASYAYPVDAHGNVVLQQAGNTNEPGTGTLQPEIEITLADLKRVLASCPA